jgi:hypothetical protein
MTLSYYKITYTDFSQTSTVTGRKGLTVVAAESTSGKNAIDAIRSMLRDRGCTVEDLADFRAHGKVRASVAGITFHARKIT